MRRPEHEVVGTNDGSVEGKISIERTFQAAVAGTLSLALVVNASLAANDPTGSCVVSGVTAGSRFSGICESADPSDDAPLARGDELRIAAEVWNLCRLPHNWNGLGSPSPSATAARLASEFLPLLRQRSLDATRAIPSAEGGICLTFENDRGYADLEIMNDGTVLAGKDPIGGSPDVTEVNMDDCNDVERALDWIASFVSA